VHETNVKMHKAIALVIYCVYCFWASCRNLFWL